jgi:Rad3-related DNA helicase/uncharacterized protein (DUF2249 family)
MKDLSRRRNLSTRGPIIELQGEIVRKDEPKPGKARTTGLSEKDIIALITELPNQEDPEQIMKVLKKEHDISVELLIYLLRNKYIRCYSIKCLIYIGELAVNPLISRIDESDIQEYITEILVQIPESAPPHLISNLQNPSRRAYCENLLIRMGEKATPALVEALHGPYSAETQNILMRMNDKAVPALIEGLKKIRVKPMSFELLKKLAPTHTRQLIQALEEDNIADDITAILAELPDWFDRELIDALDRLEIQDKISELILRRGNSILPLLYDELKEKYRESHKRIIGILGKLKDPSSLDILFAALHDPYLSEDVKDALYCFDSHIIVPYLIEKLSGEFTPDIMDIIVQFRDKSIPYILDSLRNPHTRSLSAECLTHIGEPAVEELINLFTDAELQGVACSIVVGIGLPAVLHLITHIDEEGKSEISRKALLNIAHSELKKEYRESHKRIIGILGKLKDPSSLDILFAALHDPYLSEDVKDALYCFDSHIIVPYLIEKLSGEFTPDIMDIIVQFRDKSIPYILDSLRNPHTRSLSAECLTHIGEPAVEELINLFTDAELQGVACSIVVGIGLPAVLHLITHIDEEGKSEISRKALLNIGVAGIPELVQCLAGPHKEAIKLVIDKILCKEMKDSPGSHQGIYGLVQLLQSGNSQGIQDILINTQADIDHQLTEYIRNPDIRMHIRDVIIQRGARIAPHLASLLGEPEIAPYIAEILLSMDTRAFPAVLTLLHNLQSSSNPFEAQYSSIILASQDEPVKYENLLEAFKQNEYPNLKERALKALKGISDPSIVKDLIPLLTTEPDPYHRYCILSILCQTGDLSVINPVLNLLKIEKDIRVKNAALRIIKEFKDPESLAKAREILGEVQPHEESDWIQHSEELLPKLGKEIAFDTRKTNSSELFKFYNLIFESKNRRTEQIQYMITCYEGLANKIPVIIQGGTGLGKTLALITAFLPFLQKGDYRVVYCTRTIDQLENFMDEFGSVLQELKRKGVHNHVSATLHVGRETMRERACSLETCDNCAYGKIRGFDFREEGFFMDFKELKKLKNKGLCPYQAVKDVISGRAEVVACTYTYLFHEKQRHHFLGDYKHRKKIILIIDEAHNFLEDVSEKPRLSLVLPSRNSETPPTNESEFIFSLEQMVARNEERMDKSNTLNDERSAMYLRLLDDAVGQASEKFFSGSPSRSLLPTQQNKEFITVINQIFQDKVSKNVSDIYNFTNQCMIQSDQDYGSHLIYQAYHIFRTLSELHNKPFEFIIRKKPAAEVLDLETEEDMKRWEGLDLLQIYCIPLKNKVQEIIQEFYSVIFTSATLSPVERVKILLGLDRALCQRFDSPFDMKNYGCFAVAGFHSGTKEFTGAQNERIDYYEKDIIQGVLREIVKSVKKNTGIFVSSIEVAKEVYPILRKICWGELDRKFIVGNDKTFKYMKIRGKKDDFEELAQVYNEISEGEKKECVKTPNSNPYVDTCIKKDIETLEIDVLLQKYRDILDVSYDKAKGRNDSEEKEPIASGGRLSSRIDGSQRNLEDKRRVYRKLGELRHGNGIILLDIVGGRFAEGVNYEGHQMELAIIIGLPFKDFGAFQEIYKVKSDYFYMVAGDRTLAENLAYRYGAIRRVAQTAGRVHRKMSDRGVIIFMDERLLGLKKSITGTSLPKKKTGQWEYDFLSVYNLKESWGVLQPQLKQNLRVVIPGSEELSSENPFVMFSEQIADRLQGMNGELNLPKPITIQEMVHTLEEFFKESDYIESQNNRG